MTGTRQLLVAAAVALLAWSSWPASSQAITPDQRKRIAAIDSHLTIAGRFYSQDKFAQAAEKLTIAQADLLKLLESQDPALQAEVRTLYLRLQKAHALLELEGVELPTLPTWDQLTAAGAKKPAGRISFRNDIAPFLVAQCGNCHVTNRRGQFSMASFQELMQGIDGRTMVNPGAAKDSRIVEVIEQGDMPRGGGQVSDENLAKLQQWIDAGAEFDGPDPLARLTTYATASSLPAPPPGSQSIALPTGQGSVSFARDIAPILMENCHGCHINGRRASGNFSMDNFAALQRGGDSGSPIVTGAADESLLIKKLKGQSGQRMPVGRPALSAEKLALISTWIKEGASFDGAAPTTGLESVVSQAWADSASHAELLAKRTQRATALWRKVLPNSEPSVAANDEFVVLGGVTQGRADQWLATAEAALANVRKQLRLPPGNLVKGGLTIFVYKTRYDYSEFGKMNEQRELPATWQGHWRVTPLDAYVAVVDDTQLEVNQQAGILLQQFSGAHVGSLPGVPSWFAEGVARSVVVSTAGRHDPRLELWRQEMPHAVALVDQSETLLEGRLDDEASGLVGMQLVSVMMEPRNRRQFDKLLASLRHGETFTKAFSQAFGPPDRFVKSWIGK